MLLRKSGKCSIVSDTAVISVWSVLVEKHTLLDLCMHLVLSDNYTSHLCCAKMRKRGGVNLWEVFHQDCTGDLFFVEGRISIKEISYSLELERCYTIDDLDVRQWALMPEVWSSKPTGSITNSLAHILSPSLLIE